MSTEQTNEAETIALQALGWTLADEARAGRPDAFLVPLGGIGRHRHDRGVLELGIALQPLDQLEPADVRHLDVHDDEVRRKAAGPLHRLTAVAHRIGLVAVSPEQVAEQLQIELVVLDNHDFLPHAGPLRRWTVR